MDVASLRPFKKWKEFLSEKGYQPEYGARPLKRALQKYLEDPLAEEILRGQYAGDIDLDISVGDDKLAFNFAAPKDNNSSESETVAKN